MSKDHQLCCKITPLVNLEYFCVCFNRKAHRKAMESQKKHQKEVEQLEQELNEVQQAMNQFEEEGESQGDDLQLMDSQVRM